MFDQVTHRLRCSGNVTRGRKIGEVAWLPGNLISLTEVRQNNRFRRRESLWGRERDYRVSSGIGGRGTNIALPGIKTL